MRRLFCECGMTFDNDKDFMNHLENKCRVNPMKDDKTSPDKELQEKAFKIMCENCTVLCFDDALKYEMCKNRIVPAIIQAVRQHDLAEIENLDAYEAIDNQGEDDYGRTHIKNMGACVLIDDICKYFNGLLGEK